MAHIVGRTHYGLPNVPREIRRLRLASIEHCMTHGQPAIWRHRFTAEDEASGYVMETHTGTTTIAVRKCPACFDSHYGSVRDDCPACFGSAFVSTAAEADLWIIDDGQALDDTDDGTNLLAPLWRGYGPPVLTWVVEADAPIDEVKPDTRGALVQLEDVRMFAPWYPTMRDGDILMDVTLSEDGYTVDSIDTRYQLKLTQPQTMRGSRPRRHSQGYMVGQVFNAAKIPSTDALSGVTDAS
jgi:hypothetical protein